VKIEAKRHERHAFTLVEAAVVSVVVLLLGLLLLPALSRAKAKADLITCVSHLKCVGLGFRIFATDNGDHFPMALSSTNKGTSEFSQDGRQIWKHFAVLSNELNVPLLLNCPKDRDGRKKFKTFAEFTSNASLSYFVGIDAEETNPQCLLSGDRNITNFVPTRFGYGLAQVGPLGVNHTATSGAGWDQNVHRFSGNIAFGDGHVDHLTSDHLRESLRSTGDTNNRIAVPD
jgi:prepilin-type processing-associated H-X9-DG protein